MAIKAKKVNRSKRELSKLRIRKAISTSKHPRLTVFRSSKHIYAQVINDADGKTVAMASTLDADTSKLVKDLAGKEENKGRTQSTKGALAAEAVGVLVAERSLAKNVSAVVFDRNGFLYHGRIKALADGARSKGLKF